MIVEQANKCYFSLIENSREWRGFHPKLLLHLFDLLLAQVLSYGCKIWGNQQWEDIEKLHLMIYKYAFGVKISQMMESMLS